jgi:F-type H+-transporting ATPase subunit epsilon
MADPKPQDGKLHLSIVTPEATAFAGAVDIVVVPGHDGEVAFLPGHAAYVGLLGSGELRFHEAAGGTRHCFLAGGVVQVVDDRVSVVAERVVPAASIDAAKAQAEVDAASRLPAGTDEEIAAREKALRVARSLLHVARRAAEGAHVAGPSGPRH